MTEYATLNELEEIALQSPDLLGEDKDMDTIAEKVGKPLRQIGKLDEAVTSTIESYSHPFELQRVPQLWQYLIGLLILDEKIPVWLNDNNAFNGSSPREKLSVLEPTTLLSNVTEVATVFYKSLAFATVPPLPSARQLYYATRLAQVEQLESR